MGVPGANRYALFSSVLLLFVLGLLLWFGWMRMDDYRRYHQELARSVTTNVAIEIEHSIVERQRLVGLFAAEHLPLLQRVVARDEAAAARLAQSIAQYFPTHFTHTLTDAEGRNLFDDIEGLVGALCLDDIASFLASKEYRPRVHPHSEWYHYDVMSSFTVQNREWVLFVSFIADELAGSLRTAQAPGHRLLLVFPEGGDLIEISAEGARNRWIRSDYHLSGEEQDRILQRAVVAGTRWQVVDLYEPYLFSNYLHKLLLQGGIVALLFALVIGAMLGYLRREERLRAAAERHKDEFLSNISHELRTPLTVINGALSLIMNGVSGEVSSQARELLTIAQRNGERLGKLVNELLDLKRMESGSFEYEWQRLSLNPLLLKEVESLAAYGAKFGVNYVVDLPAENLEVRGDAVRLQQVMSNLLSNAAKYGPRNARVTVRLERRDKLARIIVNDLGEGISPEFRQRLFQRFSRAHFSAGQEVGGAGLGLSISKQIIEDHGGTIDVEHSEPGGNSFYFELPLLE